jgi:hypothetical protein
MQSKEDYCVIHCLHCVRRLLTQPRTSMRAFLLCALLLGSQFGLVIYPAFAQGSGQGQAAVPTARSVNQVQATPQPQYTMPDGPSNGLPNVLPGGPPNGAPHAPPHVPPHVPPHMPPHVPPRMPPHVPPQVPPQAPSRGAPAITFPSLPPTGSCPFAVISQC